MRPTEQMHTATTTTPQPDSEPALREVGTFAAGQSRLGEYHVAAEVPVGTFASGLTAADGSETA